MRMAKKKKAPTRVGFHHIDFICVETELSECAKHIVTLSSERVSFSF